MLGVFELLILVAAVVVIALFVRRRRRRKGRASPGAPHAGELELTGRRSLFHTANREVEMLHRTRFFPSALVVLVLAGLPLLNGCSSESSDPVTNQDVDTVVFDISGSWNGSWRVGNLSGNLNLTLAQTGSTLSGTIAIQGSPCMSAASLTGTVSGDTVAIGAVSASSNRYDYAGTIRADGLEISGTWTGGGSCAAGQSGTFSLTKR